MGRDRSKKTYILIFMHTWKDQFHNLLPSLFVPVSNSSMLENKVTKCYDEYYRGDNFYKDITETQYKYLVSVGGTMNEEMGFLVHECFANMISPWNAISVAQCNLYR